MAPATKTDPVLRNPTPCGSFPLRGSVRRQRRDSLPGASDMGEVKPAGVRILWALVPGLALAAAYLPHLGRGFLKDDYGWLLGSRVEGLAGVPDLFSRHNGFYRPLVSLSFTLSEACFGLEPWFYGFTNLVLVGLGAWAVAALVRALGGSGGLGIVAASIWALNPHGIGMAVLWISGRTSLLLTLFAVLAARAFVLRRTASASAFTLLALLSKEEAVLLPGILFVWGGVSWADGPRFEWRQAARRAWPLLVPLAVYLLLRVRTTAYLPWSAPGFYAPTLAPAALARNVFEYLDRAGTFAAACVILAGTLAGRWPRPDARERNWALLGLAWLVGGYGLTVFLPVRSSLYAVFPAVGTAIVAAALLNAISRAADPRRALRMRLAAVTIPFLLLPVYWSRNLRLAREAEFAAQIVADLRAAAPAVAAGKLLVVQDASDGRRTLAGAFGSLIREAVRVATGVANARVWVEPPSPGAQAAGLEPPGAGPVVRYVLRNGRLVRQE